MPCPPSLSVTPPLGPASPDEQRSKHSTLGRRLSFFINLNMLPWYVWLPVCSTHLFVGVVDIFP